MILTTVLLLRCAACTVLHLSIYSIYLYLSLYTLVDESHTGSTLHLPATWLKPPLKKHTIIISWSEENLNLDAFGRNNMPGILSPQHHCNCLKFLERNTHVNVSGVQCKVSSQHLLILMLSASSNAILYADISLTL